MGNTDEGRPPEDHARFRSTRWSVVVAVREGSAAEAHEALAALCGDYWYPLFAFVRRRGYDPLDAEDLVQGFFVSLLERGDLAVVDQRKGRFRSYLLASCSHFIANRADHDRAVKRGGGRAMVAINRIDGEDRYACEPAHELTAERLFERQWALTLLERVLARLEAEMVSAGQAQRFATLRPALLGDGQRAPYAMIADRLGLTEEAARAAATRLRRRYRELLRDEVAGTVDDPDEVDDEILALFGALAIEKKARGRVTDRGDRFSQG